MTEPVADEKARSVWERVDKAVRSGPVVDRKPELAAALLWLLETAERLAGEESSQVSEIS